MVLSLNIKNGKSLTSEMISDSFDFGIEILG